MPAGADSRPSLFKNATANLARAGSAAVAAVLLPAFLSKSLDAATFSVWSLVLQLATFASLLEAGFQVAIGKFVAQEMARNDEARRDAYFTVGLTCLIGLALLGLVLSGAAAALLERFFPNIPASLIADAKGGLFVMASAVSTALIASASVGYFVGLERNVVPSFVFGVGRILQCLATALIAKQTHALLPTATAFAVASLLTTLVQCGMLFAARPRPRLAFALVQRDAIAQLVGYSLNLGVWTIAMLMVSGLDLPIVASFDFVRVGAYSVSASVITLFVGLVGTLFSVLVPRASALLALGKEQELQSLTLKATRMATLLSTTASVIGIWLAHPVLSVWVGPRIADLGAPILRWLLVANAIRMPLTPFASVLMGSGKVREARLTPIAEGVSNLVCSLVLVRYFGALGVAYGTVVGAIVGFLFAAFYSMPRTRNITCGTREFLTGVAKTVAPVALVSAGLSLASGFLGLELGSGVRVAVGLVAAILGLGLARFALEQDERVAISRLFAKFSGR